MKNIFCLVGFRAAGKSTLAKALGERFHVPVVDMDTVLESRIGAKTTDFIEHKGIEAFRYQENKLLSEILVDGFSSSRLLLATGGGIVEWEKNQVLFQKAQNVAIAYLKVSPESLWERISQEPERQKVGNLNSLEAVKQMLRERDPKYRKIARFQILNQDIRATLCELENIVGELWQV